MFKAILIALVILFLLVLFMILFLVEYQRKKRSFKIRHMNLANQYKEELLRSQLEIKEQTLKNISQEIHDNIGQTLSLAKLNLNTIPPEKQNGLSEKITHTRDLVGKAIQDLRSLSKTLNTDTVISAGLLAAIEYELAQLERSGAYNTALKIIGAPKKLEGQKELILFRMVQEAINNTIKHAEANRLIITVDYTNGFTVTIADNGRGFTPPAATGFDEGLGLKNMRNRADLIGGTLGIESNGTSGTQVSITLTNTAS